MFVEAFNVFKELKLLLQFMAEVDVVVCWFEIFIELLFGVGVVGWFLLLRQYFHAF